MNGPRNDHTKWSNSEKNKYHMVTHMGGILKKKKKTHRKRDQICSYQKQDVGEEPGAGGRWSKGTHFQLWDKDEQWNVQHENYGYCCCMLTIQFLTE